MMDLVVYALIYPIALQEFDHYLSYYVMASTSSDTKYPRLNAHSTKFKLQFFLYLERKIKKQLL